MSDHEITPAHGWDQPVDEPETVAPYFTDDIALANELAWENLPDEMLALCLLFARHDYRCLALRDFHRECAQADPLDEELVDGIIDTVPIIEILAMEDDSAVPQPLRAVCHWFHDKLLDVWEEYHND